MTIKKTITGNQGVKNKSFEFKVAVNGGQGELYKVVVKKNANAQALTEYITSNEAETSYQISDTGSITIYGLTKSDKYTVTETDAKKMDILLRLMEKQLRLEQRQELQKKMVQ